MLSQADIDRVVDAALEEDLGKGDITSDAVLLPGARLSAAIVAREAMVVCGLPVAERAFKRLSADCEFSELVKDGFFVGPDTDRKSVV